MYFNERSSEDRTGDDNNGSKSEKKPFDGPVEPDGFIDTNWHEVLDNFDDMNLNVNLLRGIYAYGFEKPSVIQQRAIIPCVKGHDVIVQAQSGTGKTATFAISILQQIDPARCSCQALIIAPTRDLVLQITKEITALGDFMNIECHAIIGGINIPDDIRKIEMGVHIVIGTPGRVYNMLTSQALRPDTIKLFVLDETDKLLWRGYKDHIHEIFKALPRQVQVILVSDTMPEVVMELVKHLMRDPVSILVKKDKSSAEE